ncbi:MAG: RecX family transcriptional regulator [Dehalococcoidales bacterium]|nr:RecX family transcriptional regulator [Dehalococcoidales bacterium]
MSEISQLLRARTREKQVRVFLNGKFAFSLQAEAAVKEGLRIGQELTDSRVDALVKSERYRRCLAAAVRYLGYRPRSEAEVRDRLHRRGFAGEDIEAVMAKLKEQGFVDDAAFVRFWTENRDSFSPRSQRLTRLELTKKGVHKELVDRVVGAVDDKDSAYRAAIAKARRLPLSDYQLFRRRLGDYLRRRGFSYEVANQAISLTWKELGGLGQGSSDDA